MYTVLLVTHTILVLFLIGIILIQRSDQDGMGLSGGGNQFLSGRAQANLLTRTTAILATLFILNSLVLAIMSGSQHPTSIVDEEVHQEAPLSEKGSVDEKPVKEKVVPTNPEPKAEKQQPSVPQPE